MATFGGATFWGVVNHYPGVPDDECQDFMAATRYQYMMFL